MRYTDRIKNLAAAYPALSRVWIKTGDPKTPLKSVWISDSRLRNMMNENCTAECKTETVDLVDDHLPLAA